MGGQPFREFESRPIRSTINHLRHPSRVAVLLVGRVMFPNPSTGLGGRPPARILLAQ
jgi:hypothetical protein